MTNHRKKMLRLHIKGLVIWEKIAVTIAATALLVRAAHYLPFFREGLSDAFIGGILILQFRAFLYLYSVLFHYPKTILTIALLVLCLFLMRSRSKRGRFILPAWGRLLAFTLLIPGQFALDVNASLSALLALTIAGTAALRYAGFWSCYSRALAYGIALALCCFLDSALERSVAAVFLGFFFGLDFFYGRIEFFMLNLLRIYLVPFAAAIVTLLPWLLPLHNGIPMHSSGAYSFCESPETGKIFAAVPTCDLSMARHGCRGGYIDVIDTQTLKIERQLKPMSDAQFGRIEQLLCLPDRVVASMSNVTTGNLTSPCGTISFLFAAPEKYRFNAAGRALGCAAAFDAPSKAVFFTGEYTHDAYRWDIADDRGKRIRPWPENPWYHNRANGSLMVHSTSVDEKNRKAYFAEWVNGRSILELHLDTLEFSGSFAVNSGAALGATVDPEKNRIYVAGTWGLDVFDTTKRQVTARKRIGFVSRPPVIDKENNTLIINSTIEGKIRILDRDTLSVRRVIPVGYGGRHVMLTRGNNLLFGSSGKDYYYWKTAELYADR